MSKLDEIVANLALVPGTKEYIAWVLRDAPPNGWGWCWHEGRVVMFFHDQKYEDILTALRAIP